MGFSSKAGKDLEIAENSYNVLRLSKVDDQLLPPNLTPHVQISSRFLPMIETTRDEVSRCWEVSQPANSDVLSYRFALVSKDSSDVHFQEDPNHVLYPVEDKASFVIRLDDQIHNFQVDIQQKFTNDAKAPENHSARLTDVNRSVSIKDLVLLGSSEAQTDAASAEKPAENRPAPISVQSRSIGTDPLTPRYEDHQGLYVNRSVGNSPRRFRISSDISMLDGNSGVENEVPEDMPEATGAVAAAAVSERMLLPKERRQLAIVLVGLPARGKTFTAVKLTRYLRWLGHDTKHFNVGKYRRLKHGCTQSADFFRSDNQEGVDARNEVAILAMEDMLSWMEAGGQIGVFDATNSTKERRNLILRMAEAKCKVIFLETICKDESIIERNINLKIQQSPDYADQTDYEAALADFKARLRNYEKAYETVDEGSYIKMIDTVTGQGGQIQVNGISGYLPGRIVFFLVNTHITPRPIFLTRHGESIYNLSGQIGGDAGLSNAGEEYASKLANFLAEKLKLESTASVWTSTLQRTILTAEHIVRFPKVQWRALDEINAGICDGMTYEEIRKKMPDEFQARKLDKLRYRYPRGESYLDVIQRLEPVIIELERQRAPVVVIAHQAVLRSLYAYFADKPLKEIPHIEVPLHTVIEIQMGVTGIQEKRYKLMEVI